MKKNESNSTNELNSTNESNSTNELNSTNESSLDYESMSKDELIKLLKSKPQIKVGRKEQVLQCLMNGMNSIDKIAETLGISNKNVSSQLTYLRQELVSDNKTIITYRLGGVTKVELKSLNEI